MMLFFFFSSRRRHTRLQGDWSSDVCSSDLVFALKEEILVTVGAQQAFYLLADALLAPSQRLGFEEPGHPHARNTFSLRRPHWVPVAVDGEGVVVDGLPPLEIGRAHV